MKILKNEKGQSILEMLLMLVLVLGIWTAVTKTLASKGTFNTIFGEPWERLKNTVEYGVPSNEVVSMQKHPASLDRHSTRTAL